MKKGPQRLGSILPALAETLGVESPAESARIFAEWSEIVGEQIASKCRPASLKDGVLRVKTDSAAWAGELRYFGPQLVRNVNAKLGKELVKKVVATVSKAETDGTPGSGARKRPKPPKAALPGPSESQISEAEKLTSSINDEKLAEAAKKALLAAKMRRRRG